MNLHRKVSKLSDVFAAIMLCAVLLTVHAYANVGADPLPSWNNGPAKLAIMSFVKEVTDKSGASMSSLRIASRPSIKTAPSGSNIPCTLRPCLHWPGSTNLPPNIPNGNSTSPSRQFLRTTAR